MLECGAWEGVLGVAAEDGLARVQVGQVVHGQRRVGVQGVGALADVLGALGGARGGLDGDGRAVHVVLLGSGLLGRPRPGVRVCPRGDFGGDLDVVGAGARSVLGGAAALDGQDDGPASARAWLHIGGKGDLARTTTVDSGSGEGHADRFTCSGRVGDAIC